MEIQPKAYRQVIKASGEVQAAQGNESTTVYKSGNYAFVGRKLKKRDFRRLWISRISAAVAPFDINYSRFMNGLKKAGIELNRKALSEMAIADKAAFAALVETAKKAL